MDIGEVSKQSGLPVSTLRYYEEKGLIQSVGRNGLRRLFAPSVMEKLSIITLARIAGFSLDDIRDMLGNAKEDGFDRKMLLEKAREVDQSVKQLQAVRDGLTHAANCPEENQLDCPSFQRLLRIAEKGGKKILDARG